VEGAQITIMVNFHIIILRIISLLIFVKEDEKYITIIIQLFTS